MEIEQLDEGLIAVLMIAESQSESPVPRDQLAEIVGSGVSTTEAEPLRALMLDEAALCGDRCIGALAFMLHCTPLSIEEISEKLGECLAIAARDDLPEAIAAHARLQAAKGANDVAR